jgi:type I restriction enzyme S subunit
MNPMGLPLNWQTVKFGDVATFTKKPKDLRYSEYNEVPFVPMNLIPIATLFSKEFILKPSDTLSSGTYFEPGDILLAKITPSFENGKQCIIQELPMPFGIATTEVIPIREVEGVSDKFYLFYYLLLPDVRALLTERMQGTTGRLRLGPKTLAELEIPLPPLAEQKRIVAKIETLFTQLDAAVDSLKKTQVQLQRYRRSLLKAAFEGELTMEWRERHSGESQSVEDSNRLPKDWERTKVGCVIKNVSLTGKKLKKKDYELDGELPVIDQGLSFIGGYTNNEELKVECELPVIVFGDHTKAIKYVDFDFVGGADGIKVIKSQEMYHPKLFYYFIRAISLPDRGYSRHFQFLEKAQIPIPPLTEQVQIIFELERCFSVADEVEATITSELRRAERLRQSILKHAFSGKLVSQDSNDEPAEMLLTRIKAEH